jgi:cephalosporin-C deacetylase-like acetyl esterase
MFAASRSGIYRPLLATLLARLSESVPAETAMLFRNMLWSWNEREALKMKNSYWCSVAVAHAVLMSLNCMAGGAPAGESQSTGTVVRVEPDRRNGIYASGEKIGFRIAVERDGAMVTTGMVDYVVMVDVLDRSSGSVALSESGAVFVSELPAPGTLILKATFVHEGHTNSASAGAVVEPFALMPARPAPGDFDEFWERQKEKLRAVPMNPKLNKVEVEQVAWGPRVECYDLELDCLGDKPVRGYFAKPAGAEAGSLPAVLSLHSAGIKDSNRQAAIHGARGGKLSLDINAHGLPNGQPASFYEDLRNGEMSDYAKRGIDDPETFYFLGMYMRLIRAIDFLTSQPEWNGRVLIARGVSQGGGQALVAAGLDSRVTEIEAVVPALCDLNGAEANRKSGWPWPVTADEKSRRTVSYYDACHFAARTRAKAAVEVGLADTTCPATGVLAAYNQIKGEKSIVILPLRTHAGSAETQKMAKEPEYLHRGP